MSVLIRSVAIVVVVTACGAEAPPPTTTFSIDVPADAYAASAERALEGTPYEVLETESVAALVVGLCEGLGVGAIPATIDGLEVSASDADRAIVFEVLARGVAQVCPDRAPIDLTDVYLDSVRGIIGDGSVDAVFDEGAVIRAAPLVCRPLAEGTSVEQVLLDVVSSLYGVDADSVDGLSEVIDGRQGLVVGAVLGTSSALLCPQHAEIVAEFLGTL